MYTRKITGYVIDIPDLDMDEALADDVGTSSLGGARPLLSIPPIEEGGGTGPRGGVGT